MRDYSDLILSNVLHLISLLSKRNNCDKEVSVVLILYGTPLMSH